ncbi:hypothetical protein DF19_39995 [Streptomyces olindensis]|nr:hypothetical protein DF19_39995 [Streptomyces olindensis]
MQRANRVLEGVWDRGRRPEKIMLRSGLLLSRPEDPAPPLAQLLRPRGVALRFYLLAVFEAQCRLGVGDEWTRRGSPPLKGPGSWSDFIAIDGAYDKPSGTYMPATTWDRDIQVLRRQQIHGALRTLENLRPDAGRGLVEMPRTARGGGRDYAAFSLMQETGGGDAQTPALYSVPASRWHTTLSLPVDFFLRGWIQVLQPSEVATWMILRWLAQTYTKVYAESGAYLYANDRLGAFRLRRDSYEDACNRLCEFGLLRDADMGPASSPGGKSLSGWGPAPAQVGAQEFLFSHPARPDRHEPDHYRLADEGLGQDATDKCYKELLLRKHHLLQRRAGAETPAPS